MHLTRSCPLTLLSSSLLLSSNNSLTQMMSDTATDPVDAPATPPQSDLSPAPDSRLVGKTVSALAVACHNLAVETEFTQGGDKALGWYKRSAELVKVVNDEDANVLMRQKILSSYLDAKRKYGPKKPSSSTPHSGAALNTIRSMKRSSSKAGRTNKGTPSSSNFYVSKTTPQAHPQSYDIVRATVLTRTLTATDDEQPPYISDDNDDYAEIQNTDQQNNATHTQPVSSR